MMPAPARGLSVASTSWPDRNPYLQYLVDLSERASAQKGTVIGRRELESHAALSAGAFVALPLGPTNQPIAIVAVALAWGSSAAQNPENIAEQLRWGSGWLEALPWAERTKKLSTSSAQASSSLDLLAVIGAQPGMRGMSDHFGQ